MADPLDIRRHLQEQIDSCAKKSEVSEAIAQLVSAGNGNTPSALLVSPPSWASNGKSVATIQNLRDMADFIANPPPSGNLATFRLLPIPTPTIVPGEPITISVRVRLYAPLDNANLTMFCRIYAADMATNKHQFAALSSGTFDGDVLTIPFTFPAADTTGLSGNFFIGVKFYRDDGVTFPAYTPVVRAPGVVQAGGSADEHQICATFPIGAGGGTEEPAEEGDKIAFYGTHLLKGVIPVSGGFYSPNFVERVAAALGGEYDVIDESRTDSTLQKLLEGTDSGVSPTQSAHAAWATHVAAVDYKYVIAQFGPVEQYTGQTTELLNAFKTRLGTWVTAARAEDKVPMLLTPYPNNSGTNIGLYRTAILEQAAAMSPAVPVIDVWQYVTGLLAGAAVTSRMTDGYTPNLDTMNLVAQYVAAQFSTIIGGVVVTPPATDLTKNPFPGAPWTKTLAQLGATYEAANSPATVRFQQWPSKVCNKSNFTQTIYQAELTDQSINVAVTAAPFETNPAFHNAGTIQTYWNSSMLPDPGNFTAQAGVVNGSATNPLQQPSRTFDGHIIIIQPDRKTVAEFWQFQRSDGVNFSAVSGVKHPLSRTTETGPPHVGFGWGMSGEKLRSAAPIGISSPTEFNQAFNVGGGKGPYGYGSPRAYGGSAMWGFIRPGFATDGINTAIYVSFPDRDAATMNRSLGLLSRSQDTKIWEPDPATRPDFNGLRNDGYWYMGSRIGIPPGVNLNSLGLTAAGLVIARAMQTYGAIVADASGSNVCMNCDRRMSQGEKDTILQSDLNKIFAACVKVNVPGLVYPRP